QRQRQGEGRKEEVMIVGAVRGYEPVNKASQDWRR
ncbi:MAG: hypothetical protein ACI8QF_002403, partial [Limisphaerales bacterium]